MTNKTILVKGLSEDTLRRLKKLKIELDCDTWADLLEKLARTDHSTRITLTQEEISEMKQGITEFISLANRVSKKWHGPKTVLGEFRVSRGHHE